MSIDKNAIISEIDEVIILSYFKSFCEKNKDVNKIKRLRSIYNSTTNPNETTRNIIKNELNESISDEYEISRLCELIKAFLKKSPYRKPIPDSVKHKLLEFQKEKCAICGCRVDDKAHVDHCVPFKYVGDELNNNYQLLCSDCNLQKNASIDYQMRYLLKLTKGGFQK